MSMYESALGLKWGVERRLEFIEFQLYWEGTINRSDIIDQFGVSTPQASKDLSHYQKLAPQNIEYDKSEKKYFATPSFVPRFLKPNSDEYLSQSKTSTTLAVPQMVTWFSKNLDFDSLPVLHRRVNPDILRALLNAVRNEKALNIYYQSMNPIRPGPVWRGISPHAFASDGQRWHTRAFCHLDYSYKDFLLSRCLDYRPADNALGNPSDDKEWTELIEIELIPNPKLSESQQLAICIRLRYEKWKAYNFNSKISFILFRTTTSLGCSKHTWKTAGISGHYRKNTRNK